MPRIVPALPCTPEQREMLECLIRGRKIEARLKERARIVLSDDGQLLVDKSVKFQEEKGEWTKPEAFLKA